MDTKTLGNKIAKARKEKSMSQAQLAQLLFISPQAVGKWERGESIPDILTFNKLAEILGVDLNYFSENFQSVESSGTPYAAGNDSGIKQVSEDVPHLSSPGERLLLTSFSGSDLAQSDFANISAPNRKFHGSDLRGADFSGSDLTASTFSSNNLREANFEGTNLTDCTFSTNDLTNANFNKAILIRTAFSTSALDGARFTDNNLIEVKLTRTDLRKTVFHHCTFNAVDLKYSDMRGLRLDGLSFIGVRFDRAALNEATFNGATLRNVSFRPTFALTNKYYRAIKTICFDGAKMDKLTYAELKGLGADLSKASIM